MTVKTRYFVIASLLVVGVGLGTGLMAYYVGFPASAFSYRRPGGTAVPALHLDRRRLRRRPRGDDSDFAAVPRVLAPDAQENGQREFQELTGINIETDIDRVVASLDASSGTTTNRLLGTGVVLARGRFDEVKIEGLMREHGAHVDIYKGKRLITAETPKLPTPPDPPFPVPAVPPIPPIPPSFSLSFVETGLVAVGTTALVQHVVDLHTGAARAP
jgi:hypothetical protein